MNINAAAIIADIMSITRFPSSAGSDVRFALDPERHHAPGGAAIPARTPDIVEMITAKRYAAGQKPRRETCYGSRT